MKQNWYKYLAVLMLSYVMVWGFLGHIPRQPVLHETARNLYFHVPMWFVLMALFIASVINSVRYLKNPQPEYDRRAAAYAETGLLFGGLGLITGMLWAHFAWGAAWSNDIKQLMTAVALLVYLACAPGPHPRDSAFRRSDTFVETCRQVSAALEAALA